MASPLAEARGPNYDKAIQEMSMMTVYEKVEEARAKYPKLSVAALCKKIGVPVGTYWTQKRRLKKTPAPAAHPVYKNPVPRPDPFAGRQMALIVGTPEQIREILAGGLT